MKKAAKMNFHMNEPLNGMALPKSVHVEGMAHPAYNIQVARQLTKIGEDFPNMTPFEASQQINILIGKIRTWINNNPGVNLNNITFP